MSGKTRVSLFPLSVIIVMIFSAIHPIIVHADGDPPPDTPTAEVTSNSDQASPEATSAPTEADTEATSTPEEVTAEATSIPTEVPTEAPTIDTSPSNDASIAPTETASDEVSGADSAPPPTTEAAVPTADPNILSAVPENTTVTVLDANGQSQSLATEAAADAIATASDPMWCPVLNGTATAPGGAGCTQSFTSFDALLTFLGGNTTYQGAGTIYVEQGAYQGNDPNNTINFDNYNLSNISGSNLTITGGWNTTDNTTSSATPTTFNNTSIIIGSANPWGGSLTLSNITMDFTPQSSAPTVPVNGLTLSSTGDITLVNVNVTNAPSAGADLSAGGTVTMVDSKFDDNQTTGARVRHAKSVSIVGTLAGASSFSSTSSAQRQDIGLDIQDAGAVSLFNIVANNNTLAGANINTTGAVTIGTSVFSGNQLCDCGVFYGYGLQVITPGDIALATVTANNNFLYGATLDTSQGTGAIAIVNSTFNANITPSIVFIDDTGLVVHGGSTVALTNVVANDNRLYGAIIDAKGDVDVSGTITNGVSTSTFSNNRGTITTGGVSTANGIGLKITTSGGIHLNDIFADNNMLFGAQLTSDADVSVGFSQFNNNGGGLAGTGTGLDITKATSVSLLNVTATGNALDGVAVQASCVHVGQAGIPGSGGTYSGNGQYGLNLGNSALDLLTSPTFANNGAGDIFPANPADCSLVLTGGTTGANVNPTSGITTGAESVSNNTMSASAADITLNSAATGFNVFTSLQVVPQLSTTTTPLVSTKTGFVSRSTGLNVGKFTLSSILSNARASFGRLHIPMFTGKYACVYSSTGIQIIGFSTYSGDLAMEGPYRAYGF